MNTTQTECRYANRVRTLRPSCVREIMKAAASRDVISFAGGLPNPRLFPVDAIAEAAARVLKDHGSAALQYSSSEGYAPLREYVAETCLRRRGIRASADDILLTSGSQQALDLVGKVMLDMGSRVMTQSPTYLGALQAFSVFEPEVIGLPNDDQGVQIATLEREQLRYGARFLYLLPTFQNPTGLTLSASRREELASSLNALGLPVVEDNPYGELWFDNPPPAPISSLLPEQSLYLGSFSKVLAPGLRLGYVVAPEPVFGKMVQAKQAADLHTPSFSQRIVYEAVQDGFLDAHIPSIRTLYGQQCERMLAALEREFPKQVTWNRPDGGMFIWVDLPEGVDSGALLAKAIERNVAFVPGAPFFAGQSDVRTLRLSFVTSTPAQIERGMAALASVVRAAMSGTGSGSGA